MRIPGPIPPPLTAHKHLHTWPPGVSYLCWSVGGCQNPSWRWCPWTGRDRRTGPHSHSHCPRTGPSQRPSLRPQTSWWTGTSPGPRRGLSAPFRTCPCHRWSRGIAGCGPGWWWGCPGTPLSRVFLSLSPSTHSLPAALLSLSVLLVLSRTLTLSLALSFYVSLSGYTGGYVRLEEAGVASLTRSSSSLSTRRSCYFLLSMVDHSGWPVETADRANISLSAGIPNATPSPPHLPICIASGKQTLTPAQVLPDQSQITGQLVRAWLWAVEWIPFKPTC